MTLELPQILLGESVALTVTATYLGPSGDAVSVRPVFPIGGTVDAALAGASDISFLID